VQNNFSPFYVTVLKSQIAKKQANLRAWPLTAFVDRFIIATSKYEEAVIVPKPKSFQNIDRS
jgi:hypothetical protein